MTSDKVAEERRGTITEHQQYKQLVEVLSLESMKVATLRHVKLTNRCSSELCARFKVLSTFRSTTCTGKMIGGVGIDKLRINQGFKCTCYINSSRVVSEGESAGFQFLACPGPGCITKICSQASDQTSMARAGKLRVSFGMWTRAPRNCQTREYERPVVTVDDARGKEAQLRQGLVCLFLQREDPSHLLCRAPASAILNDIALVVVVVLVVGLGGRKSTSVPMPVPHRQRGRGCRPERGPLRG